MRKHKMPLVAISLVSLLFLGSCANNEPVVDETETYTTYHYVSFYVDDSLYCTAKVADGETIESTISDPTKDDYVFSKWVLEDGSEFDVETAIVNSSFNVYAVFTLENQPSVNEDEANLNVNDVKEAGKEYSLVVGWYGKTSTSGVDETIAKHFFANTKIYLEAIGATQDELDSITFRKYGGDDTDVATLGGLVNSDGDVDILIGVGNNINTTGGVNIVDKTGNFTIGEASGRYVALLSDNSFATSFFNYITGLLEEDQVNVFDMNYTIDSKDVTNEEPGEEGDDEDTPSTPSIDESALNVTDSKEEGKEYSLVIGWYGNIGTSGMDETLAKHFYANVLTYLESSGMSDEDVSKISVRKYGDDETKVADLGALVNGDADVDLLVGVGKNIETTGGVTAVSKTGGFTIGGETDRYIALLSENTYATNFYNLACALLSEKSLNVFDATYTLTSEDISGVTL